MAKSIKQEKKDPNDINDDEGSDGLVHSVVGVVVDYFTSLLEIFFID